MLSSQLLQEVAGGVSIGPILCGLTQPVQIIQMGATVSEILNMSAIASIEAIDEKASKVAPLKAKTAKKA